MKSLLLLCFTSMALFHSVNMIAQCNILPEIATAYDHQARIIALDEMLDSGSADTNSIRIPESYVTPVLEHLSAIYQSHEEEVADSIFNIYCINNPNADENGGYVSRTIYVELDTASSWTDAWLNEQIPSGHPFIDSLLDGIEYEIRLYIPSILTGVVRITFEEIINLPALVNMLDTMNGVIYAERVPSIGEGNQVIYDRDGEDYNIQFKLGWDDCPSGCISERYWRFAVEPGCYVDYRGTYGPPVTSWWNGPPVAVNCNIISAVYEVPSHTTLYLSPNPADHIIHIQSGTPLQFISILNAVGQVEQEHIASASDFSMDISALQPGLYFIVADNFGVGRFVKHE